MSSSHPWRVRAGAAGLLAVVVGTGFWLIGGLTWAAVVVCWVAASYLLVARYTINHELLDATPGDASERLVRRDLTGLGRYTTMVDWVRRSPTRAQYQQRLRPELLRLAAACLAERHGVSLTRQPAAARRLIGEDLWPWLDPRRATERPDAVNIDDHTLTRLIHRLEEL